MAVLSSGPPPSVCRSFTPHKLMTSARPTRAWEVARTVVAPPSSVVKYLWEVFVCGCVVLFLSCACVSVSGVLFSVGVCVCDLLIFLHQVYQDVMSTRNRDVSQSLNCGFVYLNRDAPSRSHYTSCEKINRSHTHTHRENNTPDNDTHTHTTRTTPQTNTSHKHLTTLEGGATTPAVNDY